MRASTIGIFDSGLGGLAVLRRVREINKNVDVMFFADYANAPYGTKSEKTLIRLVKNDIKRLRRAGACKILIGCCTASTVYPYLTESERACSLPIIAPCANEAVKACKNGKIGVIGTRATVSSHAFRCEIEKLSGFCAYEREAQELVGLVEDGERDGAISRQGWQKVYETVLPLKKENVDTLILGCTHFDWLYRSIEECMPGVRIISSPKEGAMAIMNEFENEKGFANTYFIGEQRGYRNGKIQTRKNK